MKVDTVTCHCIASSKGEMKRVDKCTEYYDEYTDYNPGIMGL